MSRSETPDAAAPMRRRLIHARILALLMLVRASGDIAYRRQTGFIELHRRILTLIGNFEELTSNELVELSGQEKAQISRAVAGLVGLDLIERAGLRAPLRLSRGGREAFERIMVVADERNMELITGIPRTNLARFASATQRLTDRAALMLTRERQLSAASGDAAGAGESADPATYPERLRGTGADRPLSLMVAPPLITLTAYLQRGATIAYRREVGLSLFEWWVMSQVGEHGPLTLIRLITMMGRDKSQVGRTVKRLEAAGLLARAVEGRREVVLACTTAGAAIYATMEGIAIGRDDFLIAEFTDADRTGFLSTLDRLTANGTALLQAERDTGTE